MTHKYIWVYAPPRPGWAETVCGLMAGPPIPWWAQYRWANVDCPDCLEWAEAKPASLVLSADRR